MDLPRAPDTVSTVVAILKLSNVVLEYTELFAKI